MQSLNKMLGHDVLPELALFSRSVEVCGTDELPFFTLEEVDPISREICSNWIKVITGKPLNWFVVTFPSKRTSGPKPSQETAWHISELTDPFTVGIKASGLSLHSSLPHVFV